MKSAAAPARAPLGTGVARLGIFLLAANVAAWTWAIAALGTHGALLGSAFLAYSFGLRHALDADHISAIDNVTRKLMQDGRRPVTTGFHFALGHSSVVVLASLAIAGTARSLGAVLPRLQEYGTVLSSLVSIVFLLAIGLFNLVLLAGIWRNLRQMRNRAQPQPAGNAVPFSGGLLGRLYLPVLGKIRHSWQMVPLGFLFGLGFETATEVAVLGTSASQAAHGVGLATIMLFPVLFTVGMLTLDALDGVLMLRAYDWAFAEPSRKLCYNLVLTLVSTGVAFAIAGAGILALLREHVSVGARAAALAGAVQENLGAIGYIIIGIFLLSWGASYCLHRLKKAAAGHPAH